MKLVRPAVALATLACLAGGVTANAAAKPKPVCNQIVDDKGDGNGDLVGTGALPNDPAWDIRSADIATNASTLTAVLRLDKLSTKASSSPTGLQWRMDFTVGDAVLYVQAVQDTALGLSGSYGYVDTTSNSLGAVTPVIDLAKNEVRISVPLGAFDSKAVIKKAGTKLVDINASAGRFYDLVAVTASEPTDEAASSKPFTTGTLTCVKVGS